MAPSNLSDDPIVPGSAPPPTNALVAIVEMGMGGIATDDRVRIGMVSVVPTTGEVIWDEFDGKDPPSTPEGTDVRLTSQIGARNSADPSAACRTALARGGVEQGDREDSQAFHRRSTVRRAFMHPLTEGPGLRPSALSVWTELRRMTRLSIT